MVNTSTNDGNVIYSLLAIICELNESYNEDGSMYKGRAVAHLLGFKYRFYHERGVAVVKALAAASAQTSAGKDGKAIATASGTATVIVAATTWNIIYL